MAIRLLGTEGGDDKDGILTVNAKWHVGDYQSAISFIAQRAPFEGLDWSTGNFSQEEDGDYVVNAKYEGIIAPPGAGNEANAAKEFDFDGSMEKERIETHPKYAELKAKFGWNVEDKMFPLFAPQEGSEDGLAGDDQSGDQPQSPLAGQDSWLVIGAEYTVSYSARTIPSGLFLGIGTIVERPPGIEQFQIQLGKRKFLKLAPKVTKRGNAVTIRQRYQLSGPNGIPTEVYGAGQLEGGDTGGSAHDAPISVFAPDSVFA